MGLKQWLRDMVLEEDEMFEGSAPRYKVTPAPATRKTPISRLMEMHKGLSERVSKLDKLMNTINSAVMTNESNARKKIEELSSKVKMLEERLNVLTKRKSWWKRG